MEELINKIKILEEENNKLKIELAETNEHLKNRKPQAQIKC